MTEAPAEIEDASGVPPRFADAVTANLNRLAATFEQQQGVRKAHEQRLGQHLFGPGERTKEQKAIIAAHPEVVGLKEIEDRWAHGLASELQDHVLWDWLEPLKGISGSRTARLIAKIAHPWRFPGQQCNHCGTTFPVGYVTVGQPCPLTDQRRAGGSDGDGAGLPERPGENDACGGEACPGIIQPPRRHGLCRPPDRCGRHCGFGVKSFNHYFGLMPGGDGRLIRCRSEVQASFAPQARALLLGTDGTGDQIKRHIPDYATVAARHGDDCCNTCSSTKQRRRCRTLTDYGEAHYVAYKTRHSAADVAENEVGGGADRQAPTDLDGETEHGSGVVPAGRVDKRARLIASKKFAQDLLIEWKRRTDPGE
jgi:hypothetical protein